MNNVLSSNINYRQSQSAGKLGSESSLDTSRRESVWRESAWRWPSDTDSGTADASAAAAAVDAFINFMMSHSSTTQQQQHDTGSTVQPTRPTFISPVPFYGTIIISVGGCVFLLCCLCWCCVSLCRKKGKSGERKVVSSKSPGATLRSEKIQPDMEELIDGTDLNDENENEKYLGKLNFSVDYNLATSTLSVTIIQAQQLPAMDIGGTSDPYVKVCLLPSTKPSFQTKVQSKTCNPIFNDTFSFEVPYSTLQTRTLAFYVFDFDRFSKDDMIGIVMYSFKDYDVNQPHSEWMDLQAPGISTEVSSGEICFSLRYVPTTSHLTVVILEAKNLPVLTGDPPDTYVKMSVRRNGRRGSQKKKTSVKKLTVNPYFNESFVFDIPYEHIRDVKLFVTVAIPGWLGQSKRLGRVELGSHIEAGTPLRHWSDMLSNPRRAIACWHQLESQM